MPQQNAQVTDITVAEVVAPQPGRSGKMAPARIKDTKGRVWNVWSDKFEQMEIAVGRTYAAMYTSGTYTNPHTGVSRPDNTIVGLNPLAEVKESVHSLPPQVGDTQEDITINGLFHTPLAALALEGDAAGIQKALRTMRLGWRGYKKESVIMPSGAGGDFDDDIPY